MNTGFSRIRRRPYAGGLVLAAVLLTGRLSAAAEPLPQAVPPVLLVTPFEPGGAADRAAWWAKTGFNGIVFQDLIGDLNTPLAVTSGEDGGDSALVEKVRAANAPLAEAGLRRNFLAIPIAPEDAWFTDREKTRAALARFREAGTLCQKTGLRGIAVDIGPSRAILDYRWEGYDLDEMPAPAIAQRARDFGRRSLRAFFREYPRGEVLVLGENLDGAGPLWFALFNGMVESLGAAQDLQIHLLARDTAAEAQPGALKKTLERQNQLLSERMDAETLTIWRRQGSVAAGIAPIGLTNGVPCLSRPAQELRVQLAAAKAYSKCYVWVDGAQGAWRAAAETPWPEDLRQWSASTPFDDWERIGTLCHETLGEVMVFRKDAMAAALDWDGCKEEFAQPEAINPIRAIDLSTGQSQYCAPHDQQVKIPAVESAVWLEGLPLRAWGLPAGLWLDTETFVEAGRARTPITFGFRNAQSQKLKGTLQALTAPAYSVGAASFTLSIPSGDTQRYERTLQGVFRAEEAVAVELVLAPRGGTTIHRAFSIPVFPQQKWAAPRDGVPVGTPVITDIDEDGRPEALVCGGNGDLACYTGRGALIWERRWPIDFTGFAGPIRTAQGTAAVIVADNTGRVRAVDGSGHLVGEHVLGAGIAPGALAVTTAPRGGVDTLVAGLTDGRVICLPIEGMPYWEFAAGGSVIGVAQAGMTLGNTPAPACWNPFLGYAYAAVAGNAHAMAAITPAGEPLWRHALEADPVRGPILSTMADKPVVIAGCASGGVEILDAANGKPLKRIEPGNSRVTALSVAEVVSAPGKELLVADNLGVDCFDESGGRVWRAAVPGANAVGAGVIGGEAVVLVGTDSGTLEVLSGRGQRLFQDGRAAGAVIGTPLAADIDGDKTEECLYLSADRFLRVFELGVSTPVPAMPVSTAPKP